VTTGVVIFSRYDSRRLPGKVLRDLAGRALLGRCVDRARRIADAPVVVATSDRAVDDAIERFCKLEGVSCFRGSADNVAERALRCAEQSGFTAFARVCGDSPFFPDALIGRLFEVQRSTACDVACNVFPRTYPVGASAEVVATQALRRLVAAPLDADDREHCTRYFYHHPELFRIHNEPAPDPSWRAVGLAVDTPEDLARAEKIVERLGRDPAQVAWDDVFACARDIDPR
jgi:spore coat polysaccharide biosynthesis protein SpsF